MKSGFKEEPKGTPQEAEAHRVGSNIELIASDPTYCSRVSGSRDLFISLSLMILLARPGNIFTSSRIMIQEWYGRVCKIKKPTTCLYVNTDL